MDLLWSVLLGAVAGLLAYRLLFHRLLMRYLAHRFYEQSRPPKGTRPEVRVVVDDVFYDVTDDLLRGEDDDRGHTVWYVVGPQHLRLTEPPAVSIGHPTPKDTHVAVTMRGEPGEARFETAESIREKYRIIE